VEEWLNVAAKGTGVIGLMKERDLIGELRVMPEEAVESLTSFVWVWRNSFFGFPSFNNYFFADSCCFFSNLIFLYFLWGLSVASDQK